MCGWLGRGASLVRTATELSTTPPWPRERGGPSQMGQREGGGKGSWYGSGSGCGGVSGGATSNMPVLCSHVVASVSF